MKDEEYLFFSDSFEKKNIARSSHNKRTHTGKGGCTLPSDKYTKKELHAMNGEVKSYRMNDPIKFDEFKYWPTEHQETYLKLLRRKFDVPDNQLAKMFGVAQSSLHNYLKRKGLNASGVRSGTQHWDKEGFWRWANGLPVGDASVTETNEELPETANDRLETAAQELAFEPELGICEPETAPELLDKILEEAELDESHENVVMPEAIYILTLKEKTLLERAVGMLEGLSYGAQQCISEGIIDAVQMIDSVLNKHTPAMEV